jgi:hypothetical protein
MAAQSHRIGGHILFSRHNFKYGQSPLWFKKRPGFKPTRLYIRMISGGKEKTAGISGGMPYALSANSE